MTNRETKVVHTTDRFMKVIFTRAHLLPLVHAGVVFIDGVQSERNTEEKDRKEAA